MNPMLAIMQMMKGGGNPQAFVQQIMNNGQIMQNPIAKNVIELYQKGDMSGLQEMANNLAKEKGTSVEDVKNQLMSQFGIK